jgi:hypothetical protein
MTRTMRKGHHSLGHTGRRAAPLLRGAALACALLPVPALAQQGFGAADAQVALLDPGSIATVADMEFGQIAQPGTAGTVVLAPTPTASCTVTGGLVRTGACQAATFAVLWRNNRFVRIRQMNGGTITLAGPGGATMTVNALTLNVSNMNTAPGGGPPGTMGRFRITSANGMASFRIGGTLTVGAAQAPGTYSGILNVEVQLN